MRGRVIGAQHASRRAQEVTQQPNLARNRSLFARENDRVRIEGKQS